MLQADVPVIGTFILISISFDQNFHVPTVKKLFNEKHKLINITFF